MMLSSFMTKLFVFLLSIVSFFTNMSVRVQKKQVNIPENAIRIDYGGDVCEHLNLVAPGVPPTIPVHGSADEMVPFENSVDMYAALQNAGVPCELNVYEGAHHNLGAKFTEAEAARAEAFYRFAEAYCG